MTIRFRSLAVAISVLVALSMALGNYARTVNASGAHRASHAAKGNSCKKRNTQSGTIKFSDWQFPDTLNGYQSSLLVTTEISHALFDPSIAYNNNVKLYTAMLTRVPSVKNGGFTNSGKTVILHIKPGLRWSDGREITSADFKFGWQIDMNDATGPACLGTCDVVARIDTPNKYTAILRLKHPYAAAIPNAFADVWPTSWPNGWSKGDVKTAANKLAQDTSFNFENATYPTNGAYQVASFTANERILLTPMKYYAGQTCGAYLKNLIFAFYSSKAGLIAAAASRDTDVTFDYTAADLPQLNQHKTKYTTFVGPSFTFEHLELNTDMTYNGNPNPLGNIKVRRALALALDKYGLIRSALGLSHATANQIISFTPWVNTPQLVQPFTNKKVNGQWDPLANHGKGAYVRNVGVGAALSDAKKLLDQTPFKGGFKLDFFTTAGNAVRQAQEAVIAASWAKLGVTVVPNYIPTSKMFADYQSGGPLQQGHFQVAMFAFTGPPDPDSLKEDLASNYIDREKAVHSQIDGNYSAIHDKIIDNAFKVGAVSLNTKVRTQQYGLVQQQLAKNAYWIGLFFRASIATSDGRVMNFSTNPTTSPQWNVALWRARAS